MTTEALKLLIEECENANATGVAVIDLNAIAKAKEALAVSVAADIEMPPLPAIQVTNSIEQAQIHDLREQNEKLRSGMTHWRIRAQQFERHNEQLRIDKAAPVARCPSCDDTGDVPDQAGEWRGVCDCGAAPVAAEQPYECDECGCIHAPGENTLCPTWSPVHKPQPVREPLSDVQIANAATGITPYPMDLVLVPAEQVVAFVRAIERAHGITKEGAQQ